MKYLAFLFFVITLSKCSTYSQKSGKVIIDEKLDNAFFNAPPILAQEGADTVYVNSILIEARDSLNFGERFSNAWITDARELHYPFDSCSAFFSKDTLVIQFKNSSIYLNNKIEVRIIGKKYTSFYESGDTKMKYDAAPESLRLKSAVGKKGDKVFGELAIYFVDSEKKIEHYFKGPFMCRIE